MLKHRRKKLRRVVTSQPELFPHSLYHFCTGEKNDVIHSGDRNFGLGLKLPEGELVLQANGPNG
jgi:hypothetical protein